MVFVELNRFWNEYGWQIMIAFAIISLLYVAIFENNNQGTYSTEMPELNFKKTPRPKKYSKGETKCRDVLQKLFKKPFPSVRPDFLFNNMTGKNMELDMYNKGERLACEYNGRQHYEYVPYLHKNDRHNFMTQQYRDKQKQEVCKKLGIKLISVPYTVKDDEIELYLKEELLKFGYKF